MDSKLIQQYGTDILCYRLRTARQKKRMQFEDFDKYLLSLDRESRQLQQRQNDLRWETLDPPVQKGWKRFFVLKEGVTSKDQTEFFEGILKKINSFEWSHRKEFRIKRRRNGRKIYRIKEQKLVEPEAWQFKKLGFSENEKKFFHLEWKYYSDKTTPAVKYVFNQPWRFVLRVRPNMIYRMRSLDPLLQSRMQEMDNFIKRNGLNGRRIKLVYGGNRWNHKPRGDRYDEQNPLKNKPLQRTLDGLRSV
jgi:hypothetical protein